MPEAKKEVKELPVATIESLDTGKISLKIEVDGTEDIFHFTTTEKVDQFLSNPKYSKDYHRGAVVEFSAHNGIVTLVRKAKGFAKATMGLPENQQAPVPKVPETVKTTSQPPLAVSPQAVQFPPKETIGMYDAAKVRGVTARITINLGNYENLILESAAEDWETARLCLLDGTQVFGRKHELTREAIQNAVNRVLLRV